MICVPIVEFEVNDEMKSVTAKLPRQAVVLIHGIGEQRPMETLRAFVASLLESQASPESTGEKDVTYHSKPDTISDSYELRRFKLRRVEPSTESAGINTEWPETDFYEYYWAHHMYGTTISHVFAWLKRVLVLSIPFLRFGETKYLRLRIISWVIWSFLAIAFLLAIFLGVKSNWNFGTIVKAGTAATVIVFFRYVFRIIVPPILSDIVGDAARYFDVNPKNVARRYDILRGGVAMLRKLHDEYDEQGDEIMYRYGRIVLIGNSLGQGDCALKGI